MFRLMAVTAFAMGLLACGGGGNTGGTGGGTAGSGGGTAGSGGGSGGGSAGTGGGVASTFEGDACDKQRVVTLTAQGTDFVGSSISDTSLATPTITPSCGQKTKDVVFKIVIPQAGSLHLTATPHGTGGTTHFDPVISLYTGATCVAATSAVCSDNGAIDAAEQLVHQVAAGTVWVWVSTADPSESGSEFDFTVLLD